MRSAGFSVVDVGRKRPAFFYAEVLFHDWSAQIYMYEANNVNGTKICQCPVKKVPRSERSLRCQQYHKESHCYYLSESFYARVPGSIAWPELVWDHGLVPELQSVHWGATSVGCHRTRPLGMCQAWRSMRDTYLLEESEEIRRFYVCPGRCCSCQLNLILEMSHLFDLWWRFGVLATWWWLHFSVQTHLPHLQSQPVSVSPPPLPTHFGPVKMAALGRGRRVLKLRPLKGVGVELEDLQPILGIGRGKTPISKAPQKNPEVLVIFFFVRRSFHQTFPASKPD